MAMFFIMLPACLILSIVDLKDITSGSTTFSSISFGWWLGVVSIRGQLYLKIILTNLRLHLASCHQNCRDNPEGGST